MAAGVTVNRHLLLFVAILLAVVGCASRQTGFASGENFMQPLPFPGDGWAPHRKNEDNIVHYRWLASGENGHIDTSIAIGLRRDISGYMEFDTNLGRSKCTNSERAIIANVQENGYPTATWYTRCELADGSVRSVLQKAIQGQDSFYLIKRIWPALPTKADYTAWRDYLETVAVCDTRRPGSCPADFVPQAIRRTTSQ